MALTKITGEGVGAVDSLGIGTSSPSYQATIFGSSTSTVEIESGSDTGESRIYFTDPSTTGVGEIGYYHNGNTMRFNVNNTERMRVTAGGTALIGSTSERATGSKLELTNPANTATVLYMFKNTQVEATIGFKASTDSNFYIGSGSTNVGTNGVYLTNTGNSWNSVSDETQKTIVENIENASEKVSTLRTVMGYYNNDENETRRPFLIAQDVQAVLPEAVSVQDIETGVLGMSYTDVIPLLTAAIKEQRETINALEARITALEDA